MHTQAGNDLWHDLSALLAFQSQLTAMALKDPSLKTLSLRQVLRVARHLANYPASRPP